MSNVIPYHQRRGELRCVSNGCEKGLHQRHGPSKMCLWCWFLSQTHFNISLSLDYRECHHKMWLKKTCLWCLETHKHALRMRLKCGSCWTPLYGHISSVHPNACSAFPFPPRLLYVTVPIPLGPPPLACPTHLGSATPPTLHALPTKSMLLALRHGIVHHYWTSAHCYTMLEAKATASACNHQSLQLPSYTNSLLALHTT